MLFYPWPGLAHLPSCQVATFDGDTPKEDRDYIRDTANIVRLVAYELSCIGMLTPLVQIFTNPDMLHITILPREES